MYRPIVPVSGLQGWQFLKRTMPQQSRVFENSREIQREEKYFRENISKIRSADDLLGDRRLLRVALAAFGLEEEASKTFFLRRILTDDISSTDALANKLLDKRFLELSKAFGFAGNSTGNTARAGFVDSIATKFRTRSFEVAVGDVDNDMRLAMTFAREIGALAQGASE
ncbi:MAG TPA: DUF1217 domain-containing protein, partial [Paracoccaceae bacterium]|nr:DUF1217 domain-containing protein [Paracoccaceae bacterium]